MLTIKCPNCKEEMIEIEFKDGHKEYECWDCKVAFKENLTFLGRVLRKFKII
ncbi:MULTISPECIES: hypothetical protein [Clostridium]|uniref:hypothetical protein n=1 Tax=Clostridium TaxID=1485 RepID=UPI000B0B571C|nr:MULTISPECIES: hypothetical protein [Clostridium]MCD3202849.1 hypothetical protein [Clostridium botulinum C/D]MCD3253951.1 hypothetical protein [Clostridium botulinum C/D]MCD3279453.1 hypothetical protein [Clostridium botulinum C/D]MCD3282776.1 hypothetical protein [Clostridium botulinum C/D]MCD3356986.1 hypothetical protein [Clostridium botulinum C/D]